MEALVSQFRSLAFQRQPYVCAACRNFSSTSPRAATLTKRRKRDPFREAQARARKAANLSRQDRVQKQRVGALGDPVLGTATPFTQSLDAGTAPPPSATRSSKIPLVTPTDAEAAAAKDKQDAPSQDINFFLNADELETSLSRSLVYSGQRNKEALNSFINGLDGEGAGSVPNDRLQPNPNAPTHLSASEALRRITNLNNSTSKDRLHVNIRRCIDAFGRHKTDEHLPPKPSPSESFLQQQAERNDGRAPLKGTPRVGPDTGSSEVQIAVLTARIRTLAQFLGGRGRKDKMNKRNLRLMVHKRQKLLKYLERKERGGPRFRNVIEVLGLTPGAWKEEITLR